MKKLSFLFVLISIPFLLSAQDYIPFPDENTAWVDGTFFTGYYPPIDTAYSFYSTGEQVILNDTAYTTIEKYGGAYCFIRESDKKVYCRYDADFPEFVLYNFDVGLGDAFLVPQTMDYSLYYWDATVESIDGVLIGDKFHQRYHVDAWGWNSFTFIEGIGSEQGLMYCELEWVDWYGDLVCFSQNDTIYQTNGSGSYSLGQCSVYVNAEEIVQENLKFYPNPASEKIIIESRQKHFFEFVDMKGRILLQGDYSTIELKDYPDGLYLLNIYTEDTRLIKRSKIIKCSMR